MIVQASPREVIIASLNSFANCNLSYWHYAEPTQFIRYWVGYREKAEFLLSQMADGDEFEELSARVAEADHVVLTRRLGGLRAQDFTSLPRDDVPFERWWWYVDLIHEGFLEPQKGFVDTPPPSVSALFGFGVVVEEEAKEEIDVSNLEISRVWIEKGCIVCNACEEVAPEVFDVQEESCIIVPDASFEGVSDILDAADACPVEVIKWEVA